MRTPRPQADARVLVVDDNAGDRHYICQVLKKAGYTVFEAEDGAGAVKLVREETVDVIILDYALPGMSGFDVCRVLKRDPKFARIPVIFLTAVNDGFHILQCYDAQADSYLTKPVRPKDLLSEIRFTIEETDSESPA